MGHSWIPFQISHSTDNYTNRCHKKFIHVLFQVVELKRGCRAQIILVLLLEKTALIRQ